MGYYAAGGYYRAGGFSLKKLGKWVSKQAKNPIIGGLIGMIPGGATISSGLQLISGMTSNASAPAAVLQSNPGTPGANAWASLGGRTRGFRPRRMRRRRRS